MAYVVKLRPSIGQQIAELRREKLMRQRVYPRWIASRQLSQKEADWQMACLDAAIASLEEVARVAALDSARVAAKHAEGDA